MHRRAFLSGELCDKMYIAIKNKAERYQKQEVPNISVICLSGFLYEESTRKAEGDGI